MKGWAEGAAKTWIDVGHAANGPRAQTALRDVVVAMDDQMGVAAFPGRHAADFARRVVEEDLDRAAHARQPTPCNSWTASYRGSPMTEGWLPTIR